jgi:hypothetical protein
MQNVSDHPLYHPKCKVVTVKQIMERIKRLRDAGEIVKLAEFITAVEKTLGIRVYNFGVVPLNVRGTQ